MILRSTYECYINYKYTRSRWGRVVGSGGETSVTQSTPVDFGGPGKRREPSNDSLSYRLYIWTVFIQIFCNYLFYSFFDSMNCDPYTYILKFDHATRNSYTFFNPWSHPDSVYMFVLHKTKQLL